MNSTSEQRPVNLNLLAVRFPIPAIVSILHRISGVILFLSIPGVLWLLNQSLLSYQSFSQLSLILSQPVVKLLVWGVLSAFVYHLLAGIRHLLLDVGVGEILRAGKFTAALTLILSMTFIVWLGVRLIW